jgi:hypothetical protein
MGIYETPYEDFGRLTYEMWRACRLVIDTGIHQFGWSREQAMDYLRRRAALSEHRGRRETWSEVRPAALPRRHPRDWLGSAAGPGRAHGAVHRGRRSDELIPRPPMWLVICRRAFPLSRLSDCEPRRARRGAPPYRAGCSPGEFQRRNAVLVSRRNCGAAVQEDPLIVE